MMSLHLTIPNARVSLRHRLPASSLILPATHTFNFGIVSPKISRNLVSCITVAPSDLRQSKGINNNNFVEVVEVMVRDYELDQYGVVNNAVYSNYCQLACMELLKRLGINLNALTTQRGDVLAFSESSFKYLAPLRSGDKFLARVRITDTSAARIYFHVFIYKQPNLEPVLEAKATVVWLDKVYRPARIPPQVKSKIIRSIQI